jgi:DNA-binding MarR family transcriptional regulator
MPTRVLALPMYLMLALTRAGFQYAISSRIQIRMPHFAVLAALGEFGPSDQKAIAASIGFDKSDITKIINTLESQALVARTEDKDDGRRHIVVLTARGRRQLEVSEKEITAAMKEFLRGLDTQEYRQLQQLLLKAVQVHDPRFLPATPEG